MSLTWICEWQQCKSRGFTNFYKVEAVTLRCCKNRLLFDDSPPQLCSQWEETAALVLIELQLAVQDSYRNTVPLWTCSLKSYFVHKSTSFSSSYVRCNENDSNKILAKRSTLKHTSCWSLCLLFTGYDLVLREGIKDLESDKAERCQWSLAVTRLSTPPPPLPLATCRDWGCPSPPSRRHRQGKVSRRADGGSWQWESQEMVLVSLLLQTGCGRVNCWRGMPGELEALAVAQEVVVDRRKEEEDEVRMTKGCRQKEMEMVFVEDCSCYYL